MNQENQINKNYKPSNALKPKQKGKDQSTLSRNKIANYPSGISTVKSSKSGLLNSSGIKLKTINMINEISSKPSLLLRFNDVKQYNKHDECKKVDISVTKELMADFKDKMANKIDLLNKSKDNTKSSKNFNVKNQTVGLKTMKSYKKKPLEVMAKLNCQYKTSSQNMTSLINQIGSSQFRTNNSKYLLTKYFRL